MPQLLRGHRGQMSSSPSQRPDRVPWTHVHIHPCAAAEHREDGLSRCGQAAPIPGTRTRLSLCARVQRWGRFTPLFSTLRFHFSQFTSYSGAGPPTSLPTGFFCFRVPDSEPWQTQRGRGLRGPGHPHTHLGCTSLAGAAGGPGGQVPRHHRLNVLLGEISAL